MKRHFVTFQSPGTFFNEETTKPIKSWNVEKAREMANSITERYNAKPYAFYFSTRERTAKDLDSKETKTSGRYFLKGRIMTLEDVQRQYPDEKILICNMRCNKWKKIVMGQSPYRFSQPLMPEDVVLEQP